MIDDDHIANFDDEDNDDLNAEEHKNDDDDGTEPWCISRATMARWRGWRWSRFQSGKRPPGLDLPDQLKMHYDIYRGVNTHPLWWPLQCIVFPAKFPESGGNIFGIFSVLDLKLFLGMTKTSIHLLILDSGPKSLKSKNIWNWRTLQNTFLWGTKFQRRFQCNVFYVTGIFRFSILFVITYTNLFHLNINWEYCTLLFLLRHGRWSFWMQCKEWASPGCWMLVAKDQTWKILMLPLQADFFSYLGANMQNAQQPK